MNAEELKAKISKARTRLVLDHPFFGCLALKLELIESRQYVTFTVDGKHLFYNPMFLEQLTKAETKGVLAHEVLHLALGHAWRQGDRDAKLWNVASDYAINHNLREAGFKVPENGLNCNGRFKDMSAEEIYAELLKQTQELPQPQQGQGKPTPKTETDDKQQGQKQNGESNNNKTDDTEGESQDDTEGKSQDDDDTEGESQDGESQDGESQDDDDTEGESQSDANGDDESKGTEGQGKQQQESEKSIDLGSCGAFIPPESKEQTTQNQAEWKAAVARALHIARGTLPAGLEIQIQETLETHIPWYILLRDFLERSARNDYNWSRPSRRYLSMDLILPSLISEEIPEVIIAIDTSMSTTEYLDKFAAETSAVLSTYNTTIRVIYCDAAVHDEEVYTREDLPLKLKIKGGGGTKFEPVFEHIAENGYAPSCLIYFTDLAGSFPEHEPEYPTMWLVPKPEYEMQGDAPFGMTVEFNL